jgi:hypothetical protein
MDTIFTLNQITKALGISRARIEQWISRGYFRTPDKPILGMPRDWDIGEAIRLALCVELTEAQISPLWAGQLTFTSVHGFTDDIAYFVAWQGFYPGLIPMTHRGDPIPTKDQLRKIYMPGTWIGAIIKGQDLPKFLENPDVMISVIVNLDNLEKRVNGKLLSKADKAEG